jgi:hypothetical protein
VPRALSPEVLALIADDVVRPALCVQMIFDSGEVLANSTPIDITIAGKKYLGVGMLGKIGAIEETTETQANGCTVELSGIPPELISLALQEKYQGRTINITVAYMDRDWRVPAGATKVLFSGRMDQMRIELGAMASITVNATNRFADWDSARNQRYTDEEQQRRYPGDLGLQFVSRTVEQELSWGGGGGAAQMQPAMVQGGGGGKK